MKTHDHAAWITYLLPQSIKKPVESIHGLEIENHERLIYKSNLILAPSDLFDQIDFGQRITYEFSKISGI